MSRKVTGGVVGQQGVGPIQVDATAVITTADNQDITLDPSGTGVLKVAGDTQLNNQGDLRFATTNSANWVAFQGPASAVANITWTLPAADGASNQYLRTDGAGVLTWQTPNITIASASDATLYNLPFTTATSGTITTEYVNTAIQFQPSTGNLVVNGTVNAYRTENVQTTSYTIALTDRDKVVVMNSSSAAVTLTVPLNSATAFPIGSVVYVYRVGAGATTIVGTSGVTFNYSGTLSMALGEELILRKRGTNDWVIIDSQKLLSATGGTQTTPTGFSVNTFTTAGSATLTVAG